MGCTMLAKGDDTTVKSSAAALVAVFGGCSSRVLELTMGMRFSVIALTKNSGDTKCTFSKHTGGGCSAHGDASGGGGGGVSLVAPCSANGRVPPSSKRGSKSNMSTVATRALLLLLQRLPVLLVLVPYQKSPSLLLLTIALRSCSTCLVGDSKASTTGSRSNWLTALLVDDTVVLS